MLISNTDDHLRNHGFLYVCGTGWRLAPAYDLNPIPAETKPRILSTSITFDSPAASLELAFEVADEFGLDRSEARQIAGEVGAATSRWRQAARLQGLPDSALARMTSAFEHVDLDLALRSASSS